MLTWEDDVEVHALRQRGWTISAIARHTGRDRKTIADYLSGKRTPGVRARPGPDPFEPFVDYCRERLAEDPHLWATALFDELVELGVSDVHPAAAPARAAASVRAVSPRQGSPGRGDRASAR